jgi:peptidylprolyl isomerase
MLPAMPGLRPSPARRRLGVALLMLAGAIVLGACGADGEGAPPEAGCPVGTVNSCSTATAVPSGSASAGATAKAAADPCFTTPTPSPAPGGDAFCTSVVINTTTQDGLSYGDIRPGTGPQPKTGDTVTVQYTGWLQSTGAMFDSSRLPGRQPFQFTIGQGVIQGWSEGVPTMKVGGKRRFVIPPALGYGAQGAGSAIPPNATLVFDIELISIDK